VSGEVLTLKSEFAHVTIAVDDCGQGPRLRLRDHRGGRERFLDPLELECLTRAGTEELDRYLPYEDREAGWGA
jgi:hypothetical protein